MSNIRILDACCGSRMFWFDKQEPHTTYIDRREEEFEIHKKKINVKPDNDNPEYQQALDDLSGILLAQLEENMETCL